MDWLKVTAMVRGATILIATWALMVMPALCTAGVILHACDCGTESDCDHEAGCSSDPCENITVRNSRPAPIATPVPTSFSACLPADLPALVQALRTDAPNPLPRQNLPYPPSDLPLLI
jgi:hypothetical protein